MKMLLNCSLAVMLCIAPIPPQVAQTGNAASQPLTIEGAVSRVYKTIDSVELRLHIFSPPDRGATQRRPAIVFFFGGGWRNGTVSQLVPQAQHLTERGMVAIVADYRVSDRHHTSAFEAIADAKSAIRWVRAHAAELGVDPARIAAAGGSSGGHLALSAATLEQFDDPREDRQISSRPDALVLFNPAVDTSPDASRPARTADIMHERFGGRGRDGSPMQHLRPGLVPTLILHGKADTTIPYADVERFCAAAKKQGDRCEVIGYDGATHGFFNRQRDGGKWYQQTTVEMDRFLTSLGYLAEQRQ
jgi:acetyl esterase